MSITNGGEMRGSATLTLFTACVILSACGGTEDGGPRAESGENADTAAGSEDARAHDGAVTSGPDAAGDTSQSGHGGHAAAPGEGAPLLVIMQKLGADVMALTHALMVEDRQQVANTSHAIAEHAPIAPDEVERIHRELGDEMVEFERLDEAVHQSSVRLHESAAAGDMDEVLDRLGEVQRGCIECHSRFRERLLTNPVE